MGFYITQRDKIFLQALLTGTGIILFWRGLWQIADNIPIIENNYVSLFLGLLVLTLSGRVFTEFAAGPGYEVTEYLSKLRAKHPKEQYGLYRILYFDKLSNQLHEVSLSEIIDIEHDSIIVKVGNREYFIPSHRVRKVFKGKKVLWQK
ncbi:DUF504 domain-containing protein [Candidatus Woesearchaeota archaeon]|nr:DUF504 domain-containing protein [Candidatus Woesearchaeota archaeon]